ncbi:MAG TPA: FkbM family methyltransferase [Pseudacidobacterium sp.]|jgi:FkbM family methyltransferase|nr:FkbM family methyltransferase [Pseudacidobacterium sp.]
MTLFRQILGTTHYLLSHSDIAVRVAVKLRNQCEAVIGRSQGGFTSDCQRNGESDFIAKLSPHIHNFVDVGANRGNWTDLLLQHSPSAVGLLFDPSLSAVSILKQRFADTSQLEIVEAAVGNAPGYLPFFEEAEAGETSSLIGAVSLAKSDRTVPVTTIDCEIQKRQWREIDYLKIDAEGYDFHVLEGAKELLSDGRVRFGQFEYGAGWRFSGATLTYALIWLANLGYETYLMSPKGLRRPQTDRLREYYYYSNYVFVRKDLKQTIIAAET